MGDGPFPEGLAGGEIEGVDLVLLDDTVMGVASQLLPNSKPVTGAHVEMLRDAIRSLDAIGDKLPSGRALEYFGRRRLIAAHLVGRG